ncbi:TPA: hypothetical protein ACIYBS_005710, partial [Escherichia coli]
KIRRMKNRRENLPSGKVWPAHFAPLQRSCLLIWHVDGQQVTRQTSVQDLKIMFSLLLETVL